MSKSRATQRIEWRDNLLSKYELKIKELETLLRMTEFYIPLPLREAIRKALESMPASEEQP